MSPGSNSRNRTGDRTTAGFTLVEILVVLAIVSLISGTLLFALQRVLDVRVRIAEFLDGTDAPNLIADWFRDSVDGLVADEKGGADQFSGSQRQLTGLTLAPLDGEAGVPTRVTWTIQFDPDKQRTYLRYQAATDPVMTIASWPDDRGGFRYCKVDLTCYDAWPPPNVRASTVPALIRLEAVRGTEAWAILAAPRNRREAPVPPARLAPPS